MRIRCYEVGQLISGIITINTTLEQLKMLLLSQGCLHLRFPLLDIVDPLTNKVPGIGFSDPSIEYNIQDKTSIDNLNHSNFVDPNVVFNHTKPS